MWYSRLLTALLVGLIVFACMGCKTPPTDPEHTKPFFGRGGIE